MLVNSSRLQIELLYIETITDTKQKKKKSFIRQQQFLKLYFKKIWTIKDQQEKIQLFKRTKQKCFIQIVNATV